MCVCLYIYVCLFMYIISVSYFSTPDGMAKLICKIVLFIWLKNVHLYEISISRLSEIWKQTQTVSNIMIWENIL